jgi:hypothetical protein
VQHGIVDDVRRLRRMPEPARVQFYRVLGPCLADPLPPIDEAVDAFCLEFGVSAVDLTTALRGCRFLLRAAASAGVSKADFTADLVTLEDDGALSQALLSGFDQAMSVIHAERRPPPSPASPSLRCMRGAALPASIADDLALVKTLPELARRQLYRALGPCLPEPVPSGVQELLDKFCAELGVPRPELARALKGCRFLLRQAAKINLNAGEFAEDLIALGDTGELAESLLERYDAAMQALRLELTVGVLADHGKVVQRVSWRVDRIDVSDRGDGVGIPVVVLTLAYVEGGKNDRVTLQLGSDAMRELRAMCDRLLS